MEAHVPCSPKWHLAFLYFMLPGITRGRFLSPSRARKKNNKTQLRTARQVSVEKQQQAVYNKRRAAKLTHYLLHGGW